MTAEEWIGGKDAEPLLVSMKDLMNAGGSSSKKSELKVKKKANILDKRAPKGAPISSGAATTYEAFEEFEDDSASGAPPLAAVICFFLRRIIF